MVDIFTNIMAIFFHLNKKTNALIFLLTLSIFFHILIFKHFNFSVIFSSLYVYDYILLVILSFNSKFHMFPVYILNILTLTEKKVYFDTYSSEKKVYFDTYSSVYVYLIIFFFKFFV